MISEDEQLQPIRAQIDRLDEQIQKLLTQRARCALQVATVKRECGDQSDFYRPAREAEVLHQAIARNRGPLPDEAVTHLFREIMSACRALQHPLKIAFLGPPGTFTEEAARERFGDGMSYLELRAIDEIFREVEKGEANYGVVPVENSTEGVVNRTLDMFLHSSLRICGEIQLRIHHQLVGIFESPAQVRRVYSHQQSLAQCRRWLQAHLPQAEQMAVSSNAEAARLARAEPGTAAITGKAAADIYQVPVVVANIEDEPNNTTRFLIIGTREVPPTGRDKTVLLVSSPDQPGSLARLLEPFARHGLNMTRIESRPWRRGGTLWEYVFFIDLDGHAEDEPVKQARAELQEQAVQVQVLGSYPRDVP